MGKSAKPWLNYKSDAPEKEYHAPPKTKRHFKWALLWLLVGGHWGAHRLYLWEGKKAILFFCFFLVSLILFSIVLVSAFGVTEDSAVEIAPCIPWLLIVFFEFPRLKQKVNLANKKHLIL